MPARSFDSASLGTHPGERLTMLAWNTFPLLHAAADVVVVPAHNGVGRRDGPNWNDNQPIYIQLREHALGMILDGVLDDGDPLPSVRKVAADFHLNPPMSYFRANPMHLLFQAPADSRASLKQIPANSNATTLPCMRI